MKWINFEENCILPNIGQSVLVRKKSFNDSEQYIAIKWNKSINTDFKNYNFTSWIDLEVIPDYIQKQEISIEDFIGVTVKYNSSKGLIIGVNANAIEQDLVEIKGWWEIQKIFTENGFVNYGKAKIFQDELGEWIADAIKEKLIRENLNN